MCAIELTVLKHADKVSIATDENLGSWTQFKKGILRRFDFGSDAAGRLTLLPPVNLEMKFRNAALIRILTAIMSAKFQPFI